VEAVREAHGNAGAFLNDLALALAAKQLALDEGKGLIGRTLGLSDSFPYRSRSNGKGLPSF
jgi:hypothetical protein